MWSLQCHLYVVLNSYLPCTNKPNTHAPVHFLHERMNIKDACVLSTYTTLYVHIRHIVYTSSSSLRPTLYYISTCRDAVTVSASSTTSAWPCKNLGLTPHAYSSSASRRARKNNAPALAVRKLSTALYCAVWLHCREARPTHECAYVPRLLAAT